MPREQVAAPPALGTSIIVEVLCKCEQQPSNVHYFEKKKGIKKRNCTTTIKVDVFSHVQSFRSARPGPVLVATDPHKTHPIIKKF